MSLAFASVYCVTLSSCSEDDIYGTVSNGTFVATGDVKDITYSNAIVMGRLNFTKLESNHSIGVVYMPEDTVENCDYRLSLTCNHEDSRYEKVENSMAHGRFDLKLPGLRPGTKYYYRTCVTIGSNTNYSSVNSFTTADPSPYITVNTQGVSALTAFSAKISGNVSVINSLLTNDKDEDQRSGFLVLTNSNNLKYELSGREEYFVTRKNGNIEQQLTELEPGTTYYYRSFFYWNGKCYYGDVKNFKTTTLTVSTESATNITAGGATLNGKIEYSKFGGTVQRAGFIFSSSYNSEAMLVVGSSNSSIYEVSNYISSDNYEYTVSGLSSSTLYYYRTYVQYRDPATGNTKTLYGAIKSFTTPRSSYARISVSTSGSYKWSRSSNGIWTSGNYNVASSSSTMTATITHNAGDVVEFDWTVSSENGWDYLTCTLDGSTVLHKSGSDNGTYSYTFTYSGTSTLVCSYSKDSSGNSGSDRATIKFRE